MALIEDPGGGANGGCLGACSHGEGRWRWIRKRVAVEVAAMQVRK